LTLAIDAHRTHRTVPVKRSPPLCQFKFSGPKKGRGRIGDPTPFSPRTAIGANTGSSKFRLFSYCTASNRKKILCRNRSHHSSSAGLAPQRINKARQANSKTRPV
jgi:hypothetical protein